MWWEGFFTGVASIIALVIAIAMLLDAIYTEGDI